MFVWADLGFNSFDPTTFRSPGQSANTFNVRATGVGGVFFVTGVDASGSPTWGCYAQNGGGWTCTSDRNVKRNLRPADTKAVLARLLAMPVYHWQPKDGPNRDVEHLGPMAQDFKVAFDLGDNDKALGFQDENGVALAAIQGLNQMLEERDAALTQLVRDKDREIADLKARVAQVESLRGEVTALRSTLTELRQGRSSVAVATK